MDVKNDLGGGNPTLLIAEDEESNNLLVWKLWLSLRKTRWT